MVDDGSTLDFARCRREMESGLGRVEKIISCVSRAIINGVYYNYCTRKSKKKNTRINVNVRIYE